jgi:hypothetical protein
MGSWTRSGQKAFFFWLGFGSDELNAQYDDDERIGDLLHSERAV